MKLSGLLSLIQDMPGYQELVQGLQAGKGEKEMVVLDAAKPYLLACLHHDLGLPMLVLTATPETTTIGSPSPGQRTRPSGSDPGTSPRHPESPCPRLPGGN